MALNGPRFAVYLTRLSIIYVVFAAMKEGTVTIKNVKDVLRGRDVYVLHIIQCVAKKLPPFCF